MIDYTANKIFLNGAVEYERLGLECSGADNTRAFVDIVESKAADNVIDLHMDANMDRITNVVFTGSLAHFYSGVFEVKKESGVDFYNFH